MSAATFPRAAASVYAPPPAPWRTGAELLKIHGDYGSVADRDGWAQFSVFWATLLVNRDPKAEEWARNWQARGYTHIALSPTYGYPGSPIAGLSFTVGAFVELVEYTLNVGFAPVLFLSDVPEQAAMVISIIEALKVRGLLPYVICVPVWEPIPTDYYTSRQLSDLLIAMKEAGGDAIVIAVHLQPERWSMSSHPGEADDRWRRWAYPTGNVIERDGVPEPEFTTGPNIGDAAEADKATLPAGADVPGFGWVASHWVGDEQACWKSGGGEHVVAFLYQFPHGFTQTTAPDWKNRWGDGVPRMCQGLNGWRIMAVTSLFEGVLYDSYRNQCNEARAREIAAEADAFARDTFGVTSITFGNGAPPDTISA